MAELLSEPMEFVDLASGASMTLDITRAAAGIAVIHPTQVTSKHLRDHMTQNGLSAPPAPGTPISVQVPVLRVWGARLDEPSRAPYWDFSSKRLIAQLTPLLSNLGSGGLRVRITAHGRRPTKTYSVELA